MDKHDGLTSISLSSDSDYAADTIMGMLPILENSDENNPPNITTQLSHERDDDDDHKMALINQVIDLQHTLEELTTRVDSVKEGNLKLKSENQVLNQYIENLMAASTVFQINSNSRKRNAKGNKKKP